jgi:hypothetical protein
MSQRTSTENETISRELRRNAATRGGRLDYRASVAQWHADRQARRPKSSQLAVNDRLREYVQERLAGKIRVPGGGEVDRPGVPWEWAATRAPPVPTLGQVEQPGTDR